MSSSCQHVLSLLAFVSRELAASSSQPCFPPHTDPNTHPPSHVTRTGSRTPRDPSPLTHFCFNSIASPCSSEQVWCTPSGYSVRLKLKKNGLVGPCYYCPHNLSHIYSFFPLPLPEPNLSLMAMPYSYFPTCHQ